MAQRPFAWERLYPEGAHWDAPMTLRTLPALLDDSAAGFAPRPAIEFRGMHMTYTELKMRADRFAAGLLARGIGRGQSVALYFHNTRSIRSRPVSRAATAYVVLRPGVAGLTLAAMDGFLRERLGRHEMPAALELCESLPKTAVGKLARRELVDEERAKAQA